MCQDPTAAVLAPGEMRATFWESTLVPADRLCQYSRLLDDFALERLRDPAHAVLVAWNLLGFVGSHPALCLKIPCPILHRHQQTTQVVSQGVPSLPPALMWISIVVRKSGKSEPGKEPQTAQLSRMDFRCKLSARISSNNLAIDSPGAMLMAPSGCTSKMLWDPSKPTPQLASKDQLGEGLVPAQSPSTKHLTSQELGLRPPVPSSYPDGTLGFIGASSSPSTTST